MENIVLAFSDLIRERLNALNSNAFSVESASGLPPDAIRNVLRSVKNSGPTLARAKEICDALGLEMYVGPPRDTGPVDTISVDDKDFAHIPLHEALLSAGPGCENGNTEVIDHLAFRRDWLRKIGVAASNACLARVTGDSMQPTIFAGDLVLIDTSRRELTPRKPGVKATHKRPVYAILEEGEARAKRIDRPSEDMLVLISDNPDNPPEILTGADAKSVHIIGKVLWWGHTAVE